MAQISTLPIQTMFVSNNTCKIPNIDKFVLKMNIIIIIGKSTLGMCWK